jgi:hypothetical protein
MLAQSKPYLPMLKLVQELKAGLGLKMDSRIKIPGLSTMS